MKVFTWDEVYKRIEKAPAGRLYGIPRGGAIVAGLTGRAVNTPEEADWLVDDIYDSGKTATRWSSLYDKPIWTMISKANEGIDSWVRLPWENPDPTADLADTVVRQLQAIGEDPTRQGLLDTPKRVVKSLFELTEGYKQNPVEILGTCFDEPYDEMVVVREIDFSSLCEHHMLPFVGQVTVAYVPDARVVGLSKIARLVHCFARRLQIQERLTKQIAETIQDILKPRGVAVMVRAKHSCMRLRGIKSTGDLVTSCLLGFFKEKQETRNEFLRLCSR